MRVSRRSQYAAGRDQGLRDQRVPARVESVVHRWRSGRVPVFPGSLVERFIRVLAGEKQPFIGAEQRGEQVIQYSLRRDFVGRFPRDLKCLEVGHRQVGIANQHLLIVRNLPVSAHRVTEKALILAVVDAMPHPFKSGLHQAQSVAITGKAIAGSEEPQGFPRGLLRFQPKPAKFLIIEFGQPGKHRINRTIGRPASGRCRRATRAVSIRYDSTAGNLLQQRHHLIRGSVGSASEKLAGSGQEGH